MARHSQIMLLVEGIPVPYSFDSTGDHLPLIGDRLEIFCTHTTSFILEITGRKFPCRLSDTEGDGTWVQQLGTPTLYAKQIKV